MTHITGAGVQIPMMYFKLEEKPFGEGTFKVYRGEDVRSGQKVIAKKIPDCRKEGLHDYAMKESRLNFSARQYDWMPLSQYASWDYDINSDTFCLVFRDVNGELVTQNMIDEANMETREDWMKTLMFALCCCHINNVFHQDVSGMVSSTPVEISRNLNPDTINIVIDPQTNKLQLIDLGDGVYPETNEEAREALKNDITGFLNFCRDHLFKNTDEQSDRVKATIEKCLSAELQELTMIDCRLFFFEMLKDVHFKFPGGMFAVMRVNELM